MLALADPLRPGFDRYVAVDWSARSAPSPAKLTPDAIYMCDTCGTHQTTSYHRTRHQAFVAVYAVLDQALAAGQRVFLGFDFAFGYPTGFAETLTGQPYALAVWDWLHRHIEDGADNKNNRFQVAADINARFPGIGPFWGCPPAVHIDGLSHKGTARTGHGMAEHRYTDAITKGTQPVWKLFTTGSVGSQVLMGLPYLWKLYQRYGQDIQIWPFQTNDTARIACVEIFPSIYMPPSDTDFAEQIYQIKDARQVKATCDMLQNIDGTAQWDHIMAAYNAANSDQIREEGWIFGAGIAKVPG